jgi:hypothetical protein
MIVVPGAPGQPGRAVADRLPDRMPAETAGR